MSDNFSNYMVVLAAPLSIAAPPPLIQLPPLPTSIFHPFSHTMRNPLRSPPLGNISGAGRMCVCNRSSGVVWCGRRSKDALKKKAKKSKSKIAEMSYDHKLFPCMLRLISVGGC